MKNRGLIRILSIVIALLLPVSAMAQSAAATLLEQANTDGKEIVTTVTFIPGSALAADQIVADLSAITALRFQSMSGKLCAMALSLSGTDVFSVQARTETDGLYVQSAALGDKPLYFAWSDLETFMTKSMQSSGTSPEAVASFSQSFTQAINQINTIGAMGDKQMMTKEEKKQMFLDMMGGDESFVNWFNAIEAKKVVTKGEFTLGDSDKADTKTELQITVDDLTTLLDTQYVKDQIKKQLTAQDSTLTEEQLTAQTDEAIVTAKTEIAATGMLITTTEYTVGEAEDFVGALINVTGTFKPSDMTAVQVTTAATDTATADTTAATETDNTPFKMDVTVQAIKKTQDTGTLYTLDVTAVKDDTDKVAMNANLNIGDTSVTGALAVLDKDGKNVLNLALACDYQDPKHVTGNLEGTVNADGTQGAFVLGMDQTVTDTTIDTTLSLSAGESLDVIKADATKLLGSLKISTVVQADSGYFVSIAAATPDTSLQIAKMSEEELTTYTDSLESNFMSVLYTAMANLPASVTDTLYGTGN